MELYEMVEGYYQDLEDGLMQAEPREKEPDYGFEEVRQSADALKAEMQEFRAEEERSGPSPETWTGYRARHEAIKENLRKIGDTRRTKQPESVIRGASANAAASFREASGFFRRERAYLIQREQKYQKEIAALKKQLEEMKGMTLGKQGAEMAACFMAGMKFLEESKRTREIARKALPERSAKLFGYTREAVSGVYQDTREAPGQIRAAIKAKVDKTVDAAVQRVADTFDQAIRRLEQRKQEVLHLSPIEKHRQQEQSPKPKTVKRRIVHKPKIRVKTNDKGRFR